MECENCKRIFKNKAGLLSHQRSENKKKLKDHNKQHDKEQKKIMETIDTPLIIKGSTFESKIERKPMDMIDTPWISEGPTDESKTNEVDGKWMLYYNKTQINEAWENIKKLFRENKLHGIHSMKVSTAYKNPRASEENYGVIICYCGPESNEKLVKGYGKNLIEEMKYKSERGYVYYKSDEQTWNGTKATGQQKNYKYFLKTEKPIIEANEKKGR
jgi:Domain of unknown function (DUF1917).